MVKDQEEPVLGTDDLFRQMEEDELQDKIAAQTKARPIEYAKSRGIRPQKVYAAIKVFERSQGTKGLPTYFCDCGHKVVDIKEADAFFAGKKKTSDKQRVQADGSDDG
jgi:hypothetical protein